MFLAAFVCGIASAIFLFTRRRGGRPHRGGCGGAGRVFGLIGLVTGPLWGRKAWGVWWQWDARLTSALVLWLIFVAYLLLRRFGGPGSEKLAAAWRCSAWPTCRSSTGRSTSGGRCIRRRRVVPTLPRVDGAAVLVLRRSRSCVLFVLLLAVRARLERRRAELDELYLALED